MFNLERTYTTLPGTFFQYVTPATTPASHLVLFNQEVATMLGLKLEGVDAQSIGKLLSGNQIPVGSKPFAQAYAGHQFGHFTILGDGRAIHLGEQLTPSGSRYDIQLKGAGKTPYSRRGDGKATLSAMLREYIISEGMHYLGIPTSRSLAVVYTGEQVYRDPVQPGAVLTRVMQSHLRVGTFEYALNLGKKEAQKSLLEYAIARHYPAVAEAENPPLAFLEAVMRAQITLIVNWMRVGFIHGVMNTDNMSISGETFDFGPCAFMNTYSPDTVYSSIDTQGRYAYQNQPGIAHWNLAVLAGALLPLINENEAIAVAKAKEALDKFQSLYETEWLQMMGRKIGVANATKEDANLLYGILQQMDALNLDYTNTFFDLTYRPDTLPEIWNDWLAMRAQRIANQAGAMISAQVIMEQENPAIIPRNHLVEEVLEKAVQEGDLKPCIELLEVLKTPYENDSSLATYRSTPGDADKEYKTFCNT